MVNIPASTALVRAAPQVSNHQIRLHGHRINYLETGRDRGGPPVLLVHGLASDSSAWRQVLPVLGRQLHVVAPDLLGSGDSDKPSRADYSVGAHAARLRDLLRALGSPRADVVGHSFGGGVAMSFAYQFPERIAGLGLIASGGLGPELTIALRAASVRGVARTAQTITALAPRWMRRMVRGTTTGLGLATGAELDALADALTRLAGRDARGAFERTLRGAVDLSGQVLAATDRLDLLADLPILLITGRHDKCIPYQHTVRAHEQLPGSRLEILETGHFPQHELPEVVAGLLVEFLLPRRSPGFVDPTCARTA